MNTLCDVYDVMKITKKKKDCFILDNKRVEQGT